MELKPIHRLILQETSMITVDMVMDVTKKQIQSVACGEAEGSMITPGFSADDLNELDLTDPYIMTEIVGYNTARIVDIIAMEYGVEPSEQQEFMCVLISTLQEVIELSCFNIIHSLTQCGNDTVH